MKRPNKYFFFILFFAFTFIRLGSSPERVYGQSEEYYWGSDGGYSLTFPPTGYQTLFYPEQNFYIAKIGCGTSSQGCTNQENSFGRIINTPITSAIPAIPEENSRYVYWYLKGPPGTANDYAIDDDGAIAYGEEQADKFWDTYLNVKYLGINYQYAYAGNTLFIDIEEGNQQSADPPWLLGCSNGYAPSGEGEPNILHKNRLVLMGFLLRMEEILSGTTKKLGVYSNPSSMNKLFCQDFEWPDLDVVYWLAAYGNGEFDPKEPIFDENAVIDFGQNEIFTQSLEDSPLSRFIPVIWQYCGTSPATDCVMESDITYQNPAFGFFPQLVDEESRGYYPDGINVQYYNDAPAVYVMDTTINWATGTPPRVAEENVPEIDFQWGTASPAEGIQEEYWSAWYFGTLKVPKDGWYTFYLDNLSDGGRLYFGDDLPRIIDAWYVQDPHSYSSDNLELTAGLYDFAVEYAHGTGEGSITVSWSSEFFGKEVIGPVTTPTQTPSATTTPSPTVTPTVTPTGTPTETTIPPTETAPPPTPSSQRPCWCGIFCPGGKVAAPLPNLANMFAKLVNPQTLDAAEILYRVRDEVLDTTPQGQHYISLYYDYAPEIAQLMFADEALFNQGYDLVDLFLPSLQALVDGQGDTVTITADQVEQVNSFLDVLEAAGSSELVEVLQAERAARPLESMIGKSMDEAWSFLSGYTLEWNPPLDPEETYTVKAGKTIPVKFGLFDFNGDFVEDPSVTLVLLDESGQAFIGPVGIADDPNQGLKITGHQYHFNLDTSDLEEGTYTLRVTFNSSSAGEPEDLKIVLEGKKKK